jgi:hypothetical protein
MIADHLAKRVRAKKNGSEVQRVEVWHRRDGKFRVVEMTRGGQPDRWRETRGATRDNEAEALKVAREWEATEGGS